MEFYVNAGEAPPPAPAVYDSTAVQREGTMRMVNESCQGALKTKFDLTGMKFGSLTALRSVSKMNSKAVWVCRCDCGTEKAVSCHELVYGRTKSCGCSRKDQRAKDISGQRFGRLVAVERTCEKQNGNYVWKCKCDCGAETTATTTVLLKGQKRSCGCLADETKRSMSVDLANRRFGRLTVLSRTDRRSGGAVVWRCLCDCGRETEQPSNVLLTGRVKSCGCLHYENDVLQKTLGYIDGTCVEFINNTGKVSSRNTSGYRGVQAAKGKWQARITFKNKTYYLGTYADKAKAIEVRKKAEERIYGDFLDWYYDTFPEHRRRAEQMPDE